MRAFSFSGAGDRRTVVGREGPLLAALELGGFLGVPHRVSIKNSASYGFQWNRIGNFSLTLIGFEKLEIDDVHMKH